MALLYTIQTKDFMMVILMYRNMIHVWLLSSSWSLRSLQKAKAGTFLKVFLGYATTKHTDSKSNRCCIEIDAALYIKNNITEPTD
ncbi:MAG: hypothetical protein WBL93_12020 [Lutisporaceae bacterium]